MSTKSEASEPLTERDITSAEKQWSDFPEMLKDPDWIGPIAQLRWWRLQSQVAEVAERKVALLARHEAEVRAADAEIDEAHAALFGFGDGFGGKRVYAYPIAADQ